MNLTNITINSLSNHSSLYSIVGDLHKKNISLGFISSLSPSFIKALYCAIGRSPYSTVIVASETNSDENVLGFVAGSIDTGKMYRYVCVRNLIKFTLYFVPNLFDLKKLYKAFETFLYGFIQKNTAAVKDHLSIEIKRKSPEDVSGELLSIAVSPETRGKGIGRMLIGRLEDYFSKNGIASYKVVTVASDEVSNAFYRSCGFSLCRQFLHHDNNMNEYVKNLPLTPV